MIVFNLKRVCADKGIGEPAKFLRKNGFSTFTSHSLLNYHQPHLQYKHVEKLCLLLRCTPDMLLDWIPDKDAVVAEDHPLQRMKPRVGPSISAQLTELPPEKIEMVRKFLEELKK
jgi:DNA-binding Xre family transcriptional regulator